jgi:hypothetical protein
MILFLFIFFSIFRKKKEEQQQEKEKGKKIDVCYKALKEFHQLSFSPPPFDYRFPNR